MEKFKELYMELLEAYINACQRDDYFDESSIPDLRQDWMNRYNAINLSNDTYNI